MVRKRHRSYLVSPRLSARPSTPSWSGRSGSARVMASFEHEAALVRRLLDTSALPYANLADPKVLYGRETGADVQIEHEGRKIGIQVTDFSVDEAITDPRRGP